MSESIDSQEGEAGSPCARSNLAESCTRLLGKCYVEFFVDNGVRQVAK
jgi:hypothetical protein